MKFIVKLIGLLLGAAILLLLILYIALQTQWGATRVSHWISNNTSYHISFSQLTHRWSAPSHLVFNKLTFGYAGQPAIIEVEQLDLGLSLHQLFNPWETDSILLKNGTLTWGKTASTFPLSAAVLQLQDVNIVSKSDLWPLTLHRANGGLIPWHPEAQAPLGRKTSFEVSADSVQLQNIQASHLLLRGRINEGELFFTTIGADIARGALTASAHRSADKQWTLEQGRLSNIRLQTSKSLSDFLAPIYQVTPLNINRLDIIDARLEGPEWAVGDLDLSLRDVALDKDGWRSKEGAFSLNASEFILGALHLQEPIVNADLTEQGVNLRQFSSRWEGGLVRAQGQWHRDSGQLQFSEWAISGLEYTLPTNWRALWQRPLPAWLNEVSIDKLTANRNLLIDINPQWPFQLTGLDVSARGLTLAQNHRWGIAAGSLSAHAANATFNGVDVRRPSIELNSTPEQIAITELSAFAGKGLLEANAKISQSAQRDVTFSLKGQSVPINLLSDWGWPKVALPGESNFTLTGKGSLESGKPLASSVNATLNASDDTGQHIVQEMRQGSIVTH